MKRSIKISAVMHKLLIEKGMDGFSVIEARNASLLVESVPINHDEARKRVYRQILLFEKKGWLVSKGTGRSKKYFQTELFQGLSFTPKSNKRSNLEKNPLTPDYTILITERDQYQGELEIILGEISEYQTLKSRFPDLEAKLTPMLFKARERSATLLGKINVLTNVLNILSEESILC